ncbi:hypothetical protein ACOME3_010025 [Neoechinorhynchus agilis]
MRINAEIPIDTCRDIILMNRRLKLSFITYLFNKYPTLSVDSYGETENESINDQIVNKWFTEISVGKFENIIESRMKDCLFTLKVIDSLWPNSVNWKNIVTKYSGKHKEFQRLENSNYTAELVNKMFGITIHGHELYLQKPEPIKLIKNSIIDNWEKLRCEQSISFDEHSKETIFDWINQKIGESSYNTNKFFKISNFNDFKKHFWNPVKVLAVLLHSIRPDLVNKTHLSVTDKYDKDDATVVCMYLLCAMDRIGLETSGASVNDVVNGQETALHSLVLELYRLDKKPREVME